VIVVLAQYVHEAELYCYENGVPPKSSHTVIIATSVESHLRRVAGMSLSRGDVVETASAPFGRFYDAIRRQLETRFYD
jgi:hypothetical protein